MISNEKMAKVLADNLRQAMADREMSIRELASLTDDSHTSIANILLGKHVPNVALTSRIAEALNMPIDELVKEKQKIG